jgi:thioredoxin-like negative regulator of GroEL
LRRIATRLAPEDAEIAFNLAAVLEAVGRLEDALVSLCMFLLSIR